MKLFEYEAKELASQKGIPTPKGILASTPDEAEKAAIELGGQVVVKAQVLVGGRGLAGGVKKAYSATEAREHAERILNMTIKGEKPRCVLVQELVCVDKEYYLSLTLDRATRKYVFLASYMGGVEIEQLVREHPEALLKVYVDPNLGYQQYMSRVVATFLGIPSSHWKDVDVIMKGMYEIMLEQDAELVEFNPLAWKCGGGLVALDAKITIDDNSLFRHPELAAKATREYSELEKKAKEMRFNYVELDGDIGVIGNGAGITMSTIDVVAYLGGNPGVFLDTSGGRSGDEVKEAVKIVLMNPKVKGLLLNFFGGLMKCDEIAKGIVDAVNETNIKKPIAVRMLGVNEEEGRRILEAHGFRLFTETEDAARYIIEAVKER